MQLSKHAAFALAAVSVVALGGCGGGGGGGGGFTTAGVAPATTPSTSGAAPATSSAPTGPATRSKTAVVVARHGEGFLELDGGRRILHTKGTSYQRGVQYGVLVGDQVEGVMAQFPVFLQQQAGVLGAAAAPLLSPAGAMIFSGWIDADAREEMRGIVDGMRIRNPATTISERDLIFLNSFIDLAAVMDLGSFKCSSLAVWGPITKDGKLYQTRCIDLVVGSGLEKYTLVTINKPEGGVPYLNPGYAGMIGCASGLNARGLGVGQVWGFSSDKGWGRPWVLTMRQLLGTRASAEDGALLLAADQRTYGCNFVFADRGDLRGGQPHAVAVESSKTHLAVFGPDDPREDLAVWNGQIYALRTPFSVYRGDCCMDPVLRSLQRASNGPTGDPRTSSAYRDRYEGQAARIRALVAAGTKIGKDEIVQITKEVAMRRSSLQCCVYENTDLEVWVANARVDAAGTISYAYQEPYHHYSLDYYTPTAKVVPDQTTFGRGAALQVAVPLETLGRERGLDVEVRLETSAGSISLGKAAVVLPARGRVTATLNATVPQSAAAGTGRLVAEVLEAGTADLVELAQVDITVTP